MRPRLRGTRLGVVLWGAWTAASCARTPSAGDARALVRVLSVATRVEGDEARVRLLLEGCSEISSCAAGCSDELRSAAQPGVDQTRRGALLAPCFDELRGAQAKYKTSADAWFRAYLARYADRAATALDVPEQHQLEGARVRLQIIDR